MQSSQSPERRKSQRSCRPFCRVIEFRLRNGWAAWVSTGWCGSCTAAPVNSGWQYNCHPNIANQKNRLFGPAVYLDYGYG
jgi:hypothetical protein